MKRKILKFLAALACLALTAGFAGCGWLFGDDSESSVDEIGESTSSWVGSSDEESSSSEENSSESSMEDESSSEGSGPSGDA